MGAFKKLYRLSNFNDIKNILYFDVPYHCPEKITHVKFGGALKLDFEIGSGNWVFFVLLKFLRITLLAVF
jgi:hypothetical protein